MARDPLCHRSPAMVWVWVEDQEARIAVEGKKRQREGEDDHDQSWGDWQPDRGTASKDHLDAEI